MMTLIIGGSGSGKSAYAEDYMISISEDRKKYYIATMQIYDEEGKRKVERHRMLRGGKGFSTIEQPLDIGNAAEKLEDGDKTALLECISGICVLLSPDEKGDWRNYRRHSGLFCSAL